MVLGGVVVAMTLVTGSFGCRRVISPNEPRPSAVTPTETPRPEMTTVKVYLIRGEKIGVGGRRVEATGGTEGLALAAVKALMAGPTVEETEFGLGSTIPTGTTVNGVTIADGIATVDLSAGFGSGGGSLSMLLRVAQVVCTLTQFDGVDRVAFRLDGVKAEAIGGEGVIVDPPVGRGDFEGQLPAILVESPYPGETVTSPLTVAGSSNTFEATHQLNVTDPDGRIVADKTVTASSGTGTRGVWQQAVEFDPPSFDGRGAVIVFEISAKDGSQTNLVEIPVRMEK